MIKLDSVVSTVEDRFIGSKIGDELMLMDLVSGDYININQAGAAIWEHIDEQPIKVSDICSALMDKFEVEKSLCEKDTVNYLQKMYDKGFIKVS